MIFRRIVRFCIVMAVVCLCAVGVVPTHAFAQDSSTAQVYRLYNPYNGDHHYTMDTNEYDTLGTVGWRKEGVAWVSPTSSATPVYRLYNPYSGDHHYTVDAHEYDTLPEYGWRKEGVAWYSDDAKTVPVYRLFNPNATIGTHHYTLDENEYVTLESIGWRKEGIAWYGTEVGTASGTPIMGASTTSVDQMVRYFNSTGKSYPAEKYANYGASNIQDFCAQLLNAANSEGVRAEVLFAQAMHETGNLQFDGDVQPNQCNFGGLGATGGGEPGNSFSSVSQGLLAQAQHLKAYACTQALSQPCVDVRFSKVKNRGCAPCVEDLGGKWATDARYGAKITSIMDRLART